MDYEKLGITILRELDASTASKILGDTWWSGKNSHLQRRDRDYTDNHDGSGYVEVSFPLALIRPNEEGDRYDGTVVRARMEAYAKCRIDAPVHLLYGIRASKHGYLHAFLMDGGHRLSAARLRGDSHINAIMQRSDLDRLVLSIETSLKLTLDVEPSFQTETQPKRATFGNQ